MLDRETKTKNTIIGRLMALFVAGVVCLSQAIPVFADDESKTTISFNSITLLVRQDSYNYNSSVNEYVKVPVYLWYSISNNTYGNYLSGTVAGEVTSYFSFATTSSETAYVSYFEPILGNGYIVNYQTNNSSIRINFDNAEILNETSILCGYLYVSVRNPVANTIYGISPTNGTEKLIRNVTSTVYSTNYEYGFVNAMIYALNNSANIEDMLSILNSIDTNMLPEILTVMRSNHTALYNLIQNVWTTDQAVLSVDRQIYTAVLSILAILEDAYAPQASQAEDIKDEVDTNLGNLISDMELTKPSQVANIADDYIAQIDTSYNNLAFGFLSNNTIVLMLCIVAGLAIISYMLYGGQ